jgi:hypothetical protein
MLALLAATATAPTAAAAAPSFSPPLLVSAPVQCYDGAQKKLCGYLQVRPRSVTTGHCATTAAAAAAGHEYNRGQPLNSARP